MTQPSEQPTVNPIVNLADVMLQTQQHGERFAAQMGAIAPLIGATKLGCRLTVLPPGKRAFPFHNHHVNEELFVILAGSGILRLGDQTFALKAFDVVCCPPGGIETAHQIINTAEVELRYLCFSTMETPDVMEYPDSGKFGVFVGAAPGGNRGDRTFSIFSPKDAAIDYWDGEE